MNILFVFGNGSEVRQFLHSGLINELLKRGNSVFISSKISIVDEINKHGLNIKTLPFHPVSIQNSFLKKLAFLLDELFLKSIGNKRWYYFPNKNINSKFSVFLTRLIRPNGFTHLFLIFLEKYLHKREFAISQGWKNILVDNNINKVVLNEARHYPYLLITCNYLKIKTLLIFHTNKEIFAQGRILNYFAGFGLWNESQNLNLRADLNIQDDVLTKVVGSTHFTYLNILNLNKVNLESDENLKFINPKPFVLYCAAEPKLFPNQIKLVEELFEAIKKVGLKDFIVVIRKNPMDLSDYWDALEKSNYSVVEPAWHYDSSVHFNYTKFEDLSMYHWLLSNCSLCVSIPSTVTLECALMGKNIVNLCYDPDFLENDSFLNSWKASFYGNARESGFAIPVFEKNQLMSILADALVVDNFDNRSKYLEMELGIPNDKILEKHINFILFET